MGSLRQELKADVWAAYEDSSVGWRLHLKAVSNPSMHAVTLIRLALAAPPWTSPFFRNLLIAKHSIDLGDGASIGPGLYMPHPLGIVIGRYARIGASTTIYQHVTIGAKTRHAQEYPVLEDGVMVYPGSVVVGPVRIGEGAVIGANSFVSRDVEPGAVVRGVW